jgi:endonuclease I
VNAKTFLFLFLVVFCKYTKAGSVITNITSLPSFGNVYPFNSSSSLNYTVSGTSLSAPIVIAASTAFEVSLYYNYGYGNKITLAPLSGVVANTKIYVRFSPSLVASYPSTSNAILNSSIGSVSVSVSVSGTCIATTVPSGVNTYFNSIGNVRGAALKTALYNKISVGTTSVSYTPGVWNAYATTDVQPNGKVWDIYSTRLDQASPYEYTLVSNQCGTYSVEGNCYNREHSFPQSWFNSASPMVTELNHVFASDGKVNGMRNNYPYGYVTNATYTSLYGGKLGTSANNFGYTGVVFEPIDEYKGDLARGYFFMATRYENLIASWLSNGNASDILAGNNYPVFLPWQLSVLLSWHNLDPVSDKEIKRNNAIAAIQGNRNPFIDSPQYAQRIWGGAIHNEPTIASTDFSYTNNGTNTVNLNWKTGNGLRRLVICKAGSAVNSLPLDTVAYTANSVFGSGSNIGNNCFVVYNGTGSSCDVTGLNNTTNYYFAIVEYNGVSNISNYNTSTYFNSGNVSLPVNWLSLNASSGSNGSISPLGIITVNSGAAQRFTFSPNSGYIIDSVIVDGIKVDSIVGYTFNNVTSNRSIRVTFKALPTPNLAISSLHPIGTYVNTNTSNNILASYQLIDSVSNALLSSLSFTTQGTYTIADIQSMGFKCWLNSSNDLTGATQIGTSQAFVASGGVITITGLSQNIPIGTSYILVTCNIANTAENGNTIGLASTPIGNFTFSGNNTINGNSTLAATNLFTINETGPVKMQYRTSNSYKENFSDIANWTNGFALGIGAGRWAGVTISTGTIPNAKAITISTTNFQTSSSGAGIQRGSLTGNVAGTINFLSLGNTDNTSACAVDFFMDFTRRNADSLVFDAATVFNGTGNRNSTLRVYWSIDGTNFTELTGNNLPYTATNNIANSATIRVKLPSVFNNVSTCRLRFYYHNGTGGTTALRPKISIDNLQVTAICPIGTSTTNINSCTPYTWNGETYGTSGVYNKTFSGAGAWGCDSVASLNLNIDSIVSFNPFQDTIKVCGSSYTLNVDSGYVSYLWNTGSTSSTISTSNAGWYKVTVSNGACSASDSVLLSIINANILNNDSSIVAGTNFTLRATGTGIISNPLSYVWSNGANTQNITVSPTQNTNYYCRVSNGVSSCADTVKIGVIANINLKMYFEAFYENGSLKSSLNNADGFSDINLFDTIQIMLYDSINNSVVYSIKSVADTGGNCQILVPSAYANNRYYIGIKHRGSIETWSSSSVLLNNGIFYNFTNSASKAYGANLKDNGNGVYLIYNGDVNQDGAVDFGDYPDLDIGSSNGDLGYLPTDLNGDGSVDFGDYPILDINSNDGIIAFTPIIYNGFRNNKSKKKSVLMK